MTNQLSIPFKKTYRTNIEQAARDYIDTQTEQHPDQFKADIARWEELRTVGVGEMVHVDRIKDSLRWVSWGTCVEE
jgi:programmed cell death 6-interacting protein